MDLYVNDAFGAAHRAHASITGIVPYIKHRYAGFLLRDELLYLGSALDHPTHPVAAVVGGAKVSTKIEVLSNLMPKIDKLLIGGAMAYTFLAAKGYKVGDSFVERDCLRVASDILQMAEHLQVTVVLAMDSIISADASQARFQETSVQMTDRVRDERRVVSNEAIPDDSIGVDIGPNTVAAFQTELEGCRTVLWNGPMGVFENPLYAEGTHTVMQQVAALTAQGATTVVCGGETVSAVEQYQALHPLAHDEEGRLVKAFTHVSSGGGAALEYLAGVKLPGVEALTDKNEVALSSLPSDE
jgi:phosphoglycerate kinase